MDDSCGIVTRTENLWTAAMHQRDGNIVVLFQGGRLPSWGRLSVEEQNRFSQSHVDLMLTVAQQYQLRRLEGFRLLGPQGAWQRFWLIEFPALADPETRRRPYRSSVKVGNSHESLVFTAI